MANAQRIRELITPPSAALRSAERIKKRDIIDGTALRDVKRNEWSGLPRKAGDQGLEVLEAAGWVRCQTIKTRGAPSTVIQIHPDLRGANDG